MAIAFCPESVVWGDVGTWVAAVATFAVGLMAWLASWRAVQIADQARLIADQQLREAVRDREENARIMGRLLLTEVTSLPYRLRAALAYLRTSIDWRNDVYRIVNPANLKFALDELSQNTLPSAEGLIEQIHNFPRSLGADLATLIGNERAMRHIAARISEKVMGPIPVTIYDGPSGHFKDLRNQLVLFIEMALGFANEFQQFVGVGQTDYSDVVQYLKDIEQADAQSIEPEKAL